MRSDRETGGPPGAAGQNEMTMTTYAALAQRYIDSWNEADPATRRAAVDSLYAEDAQYIDPLAVAEGREAIASAIADAQQQFPGLIFRLSGPVDGHHKGCPSRNGIP